MTDATKKPSPTREEVEAKRRALETVHAEREVLEGRLPGLTFEVATARERVEKAHEDALVAARTAGVDDDAAVEAQVKAAQAALDAACEERDGVEQRIERWTRAEERLTREYGALHGAWSEAHRAESVAKLRARIAENAEALAEIIEDVTIHDGLASLSWYYPANIGEALARYLPGGPDGLTKLMNDAKATAQRIRGGETVEP